MLEDERRRERVMKATGIVRRIDDLGRVVIPKEIRRTLRIREGDPLEIFVDRDGEVILKKYSPIGELGDFAQEYADSLGEATGHIACITDKDAVVAITGAPKKEFMDKLISQEIEEIAESGKSVILGVEGRETCPILDDDDESDFTAQVISPIINNGETIGTVILASRDENVKMGELELKLVETAAGFLAKQMAHA